MALALDGSGTGGTTSATSVAATLSTTNTDCIVLACVYYQYSSGTPEVSSVSGAGLTWQRRSLTGAFGGEACEVWWAHAPSALSSESITVNFSSTVTGSSLVVMGVAGADTSTPWETHPSCPNYGGGDIRQSCVIDTEVANTFVFAISGCAAFALPDTGAGFTSVATASGNGTRLRVQYQIASATLSAHPVFTTSFFNTNGKNIIADALREAGQGAGGGGRELFIDGQHENQSTNNSSVSARLTTGNANDLIVAVVHAEGNDTAAPTVTGVSDDEGLTWSKRHDLTWTDAGSEGNRMEVWYARATNKLTRNQITVSWSGNFDDCTLAVFAVHGAAVNPWDVNSGLPADAQNNSTSTPTVDIDTDSDDETIVFGALGWIEGVGDTQNTGAGYTRFMDSTNTSGSRFSRLCLGLKYVDTPQSGLTVNYTTNKAGWGLIADAIVKTSAAPPAGGNTPVFMFLGA